MYVLLARKKREREKNPIDAATTTPSLLLIYMVPLIKFIDYFFLLCAAFKSIFLL
jgi:hypothetical protein